MNILLYTLFLQLFSLAVVPYAQLKRVSVLLAFIPMFSILSLWNNTNINGNIFSSVVSFGDGFACFGLCFTSLWVVSLSVFIFPICLMLITGLRAIAAFVVIQCCVVLSLLSLDLIIFYIVFESSLIVLYLLIGRKRYGSISAAYNIAIYTFCSGLCFLVTSFAVKFSTGTSNILLVGETTNYFVAAGIFSLMAVKAPLAPVHLWLPEAHVYAPTAGSVILAGVILKVSIVGMHLYLLPIYPEFIAAYFPIISLTCFGSFICSSYSTLKQIDLKKIVAYSSISHMAIVTLAALTNTGAGIQGSIIYCVAHGLVSPALFILVGILYKNTNTKLLLYIKGISYTAPILWSLLTFFTLGNLSFPLFPNFIAEIICLVALFKIHEIYAYFFILFSALATVYSSLMLGRLKGGNLSNTPECTKLDFFIILPLVISTVITGIGYI
uniref:NADH-ubiquinone oxidoreductase chain 4 n=1 Tax=Polytomella magna TaxID=353565 RepID=V5JDZ0_9CHLO|nr:NADH dehydrogenase subunit 4 [Polytomella magna]AGK83097.1 NADH dehydrogenase subunit 4 [Polytomella magna]